VPVAERSVPIHHRSPRFSETTVGAFRVTNAGFDCGCVIEPHYHDRPNIGVMLEGSFDLTFGTRTFACTPGIVFIEPAGETHCNCMGRQGAVVVAIQPDPVAPELEGALGGVFDDPSSGWHGPALNVARRIARECRHADEFAPIMVQGLTLELLAMAARRRAHVRPSAPAWMCRIEAMLSDMRPERLSIAALAREAGVHAAHLAREFRLWHSRSLGSYLLERRLEWASHELAATRRPISEIALDAGFADQSHFTRRFRAYAGATPRRFRVMRHPV
jgi:AraC family transcriptional regulator